MTAALGVLASLLSIALVWPQVWLSCRHRRTVGMSPTSTWLAVALNFCWLCFGLLTGDAVQIVSNTVVGAANTLLLLALLLTQPRLRARQVLLRTASGAVCLVAFAGGGLCAVVALRADPAAIAAPLGTVASLMSACAAVPQPLSLLRDRTQDLSGLSPARWVLGAGASAAWTGYGWLLGQPSVWLSSAVGLGSALLVCAVLRTRRTGAVAPVGRLLGRTAGSGYPAARALSASTRPVCAVA